MFVIVKQSQHVISLSNQTEVVIRPYFLSFKSTTIDRWSTSQCFIPHTDGISSLIFRCIFVIEEFCILIQISLKFVLKGPIDPALVWIMAWCQIGHYQRETSWGSPESIWKGLWNYKLYVIRKRRFSRPKIVIHVIWLDHLWQLIDVNFGNYGIFQWNAISIHTD